ncbi:hypothetical protein [Streptomyces sp. AD55]|uniref:hypothetical protein n=1 Tax=Streptomyces sp. AD55 TaxID=3242895 RepID=UPI0035296435
MTRVLVAGISPKTRYAIRQALGHQQIEIVGILDDGDRDLLAYGLATDSGPTPFKGSIDVGDDAVTLSGRYGRGGLRHDTIPLLTGDGTGARAGSLADLPQVDAVLTAEDRTVPLPASLMSDGPPVVRFAGPDGAGHDRATTVPAAHLTAVACLVGALRPLGEVEAVVHTTTGVSGPSPDTRRDRRLALRGSASGTSTRPSAALPGTAASLPAVGTEILGPPTEVTVTVLSLVLRAATEAVQAVRRVKSETRGALKGVLELRDGPVATGDVLGSPAAVVDASSVVVNGRSISLTLHTHTRSFEAARACALLSNPSSTPVWV